MKNLLPCLFLIVISFFTACVGENGNGHVTKEDRKVEAFTKIENKGIFKVQLKQGNSPAVLVETDENLQKLVTTTIENGTLVLGTKSGVTIHHSTEMNVYITVNNLQSFYNDGVGEVISDGTLNLTTLEFKNKGVGKTKLAINCKFLEAELTGVGATTLSGTVDSAIIKNDGVGNLNAYELIVQKLKITNKGVGNADVHAEKTIELKNNGVWNINYKGNATVLKMENEGVGKVNKKDEN